MGDVDKKVSFIIPVYQAENYLEKCLESVSRQSYHNIEIIVIDDGSTDESAAICDKMAAKDSRFVVVHQENQGVSAARNCGLGLSTGKYIMFIDADDWLESDCCELVIDRMSHENSDIGFFEMVIEREESLETTALEEVVRSGSANIKQNLLKSMIPFRNGDNEMDMVFYGPYCKVFARKTIENIRFQDGLKYGEDAIFNLQAILNANRFCFENKALYHYRKNDASVTSLFKADRIEQSVLRLKYTKKIITDNALNFLTADFYEMFENICFWIIDNLFKKNKQPIGTAWLMFRKMITDQDMRLMWKQIREEHKPITILDAMFSGNIMVAFLAFIRLRYAK